MCACRLAWALMSSRLNSAHQPVSHSHPSLLLAHHAWCVLLRCVLCAEGLVGVSSVCILGWNRNQGQEISLRLRTDDYAGFRKYLAIRNTLVHELTHNVSALLLLAAAACRSVG